MTCEGQFVSLNSWFSVYHGNRWSEVKEAISAMIGTKETNGLTNCNLLLRSLEELAEGDGIEIYGRSKYIASVPEV